MTNKKKIALFIPVMGFGGAEKVVSLLTFELPKYFDVTLILLYDIMDLPISKDVKVVLLSSKGESFKSSKLDHFKDYISFIFSYNKVLKDKNIEVVISFMLRQNAMTGLVKLFNPKLKSIISERCFPSKRYKTTKLTAIISKTLIPLLYNRNDKLFSNSIHINQDLKDNFNVNIDKSVIYNPIILKNNDIIITNYNNLENPFKVVAIGRLIHVKNQKHIIESLRTLPENILLDIYGDGDLQEQLEYLSSSLNLKKRVDFKGNMIDVLSRITENHCFVLSSLTEGFPNVLLEAMSVGLPVIATNCMSGPLELLNDNIPVTIEAGSFYKAKFGILINVDDIEGLSKAILYLEQHNELRMILAKKGFERSKNYSLDKIGLQYKKLIESL